MRVWIETARLSAEEEPIKVTLYVRVWIETPCISSPMRLAKVTLYVRVWIETPDGSYGYYDEQSPST